MTVFHTLTGDLERILGERVRGARAFIGPNLANGDALVDLDNNKVYPPGLDQISLDGSTTFKIKLIDSGAVGTNVPANSLRWTFRLAYKDATGREQTWECRNFAITADLDLSDAVETADPPTTVASEFRAQMEALLAQAEQLVGVDTTDAASAYNIRHGPLTGSALLAAFAMFQLAYGSGDFIWLSRWVEAALANAQSVYPTAYPTTY